LHIPKDIFMVNQHPLARVPLFSGLSDDDLTTLAGILRRRRYTRGDTIFHEGDPGNSLFIIEGGEVRIGLSSLEGREITLALLKAGDFFGELTLLDGEPRSADAVAKETTQALVLQRDDFVRFLQARPRAAVNLLAVMSKRLRHTDQMLQDVAFLDVPTRLARTLVQLADGRGEQGEDGIVISSRLTQSELADMIGATRESTNKWLRTFERQGLVRHQNGRLTVLKLQELRKRLY
jgi:CRP-like cAMP-binding protein